MPEPRAVRPLTSSERMFVRLGTVVGYSALVRGDLDPWLLAQAYEVLTHTYPALTARLQSVGHDVMLVETPGPHHGVTVRAGDTDDPLAGARIDPQYALSGLHIVKNAERTAVTLLVHHAIADGRHALAIVADFWSCYTDLVAGSAVTNGPYAFPTSFEALSEARGIAPIPTESPNATRLAVVRPVQAVPKPRAVCSARIRLDREDTSALIAFGHRNGLTVNALLSAAILRTEAAIQRVPITALTYFYPVDMRTRLLPIVEKTTATNVLGYAIYEPARARQAIVGLARTVHHRLRAGLLDGSVHRAGLRFPAALEAGIVGTGPSRVLSSTNWGVMSAPRHPPGLEIVDFRGIFGKAASQHPPVAAAEREVPNYVILTFCGRLSVEVTVVGAVDDKSAAQRVATMEDELAYLTG
ncbi:phthiocerol/phthiodiolone dimycocerosyl transferase family protein [Nocardia altamirensis]|uniref:phthiocerol/phthiodiolone dimycocerosyl transferase family protein n=1 Tax=Nocardia altamirensis TaxID=472158 RepID=UPI00114D3A95|nr:hypothetical protein [Nocardia altamirensis]